jgi:hypothetical protein
MMTSQAFQKWGKPAFALRGRLRWVAFCLCLLAFVLACPALVRAAEEEAISAAQAAPCKGLKPYNNLDELLYQFYINLDSDCLFMMSTTELEKIWGITILDDERFKPINYYPLSETEFYFKPYKSEKDAFYVESIQPNDYTHIFRLRATKEYLEKKQFFFYGGKMPKLLPEYIPSEHSTLPPCNLQDFDITVYHKCSAPGWYSSTNHRKIVLASPYEIIIANDHFNKRKNAYTGPKKESGPLIAPANVPCRGLKPINSLHDLLYRFYINLDSDCLFKMTTEDIEKVWDIKILDVRRQPSSLFYSLRESSSFYTKPYESEKDAFFVEMREFHDNNYFTVYFTKEFSSKYGPFFSDELFDYIRFKARLHPLLPEAEFIRSPSPMNNFYWNSSDRKRFIWFPVFNNRITRIEMLVSAAAE